jgi:glycosyltransferase involved in cell wall biosynthesis
MLSQFYPPVAGGQERHVQGLAAALASRGHHVEVLTTATPALGSGASDEHVGDVTLRIHRARTTAQRVGRLYSDPERPHATPFPDLAMSRAVRDLLAWGSYDVVHAHDWIVQSALSPARRARVPVVLTLHDYSHVCATKRLVLNGTTCPGPAPSRCARCSAVQYGAVGPAIAVANYVAGTQRRRRIFEFIAVSNAVADSCGLGRSGVSFAVVPNFIPDSLVADRPPDTSSLAEGPILYAGDVTTDKGAAVLLQAYQMLDSPPELVLAGRNLLDKPDSVPPGVRMLGVVGHDTVMSLMSSARVVVVPSICADACPTVVLEAMATGRPVVASATGGIGDLVDDGTTGKLVPSADPDALAAAMESVLQSPESATALGRAGLERVRAFTASAVAAKVEAIYERALKWGGADA